MSRFFIGTRYLIIIPVLGLGLAAAIFFVVGGYNLIRLLVTSMAHGIGLFEIHENEIPFVIEVIEYVHQFLIGTVLYITSIGFYQLFIKEIEFPGWLKIDSTEELETNLVGVTVVVLAVNFLGIAFTGSGDEMLRHGAAIALPIAALGVFVALRAWGARQERETAHLPEEEPKEE